MPMHAASWSGHADVAKLLVEKGANINAKSVHSIHLPVPCSAYVCADRDGETPLHAASLNVHTNVAKLLVKHGADINTKRAFSLPLHHISKFEHLCRVGRGK